MTALWDMFPLNPGHALIVPNRHVADWFSATEEERAALMRCVERCKREIERHHRADGYNVGFNSGAAAGQTVFHLHMHVIPRLIGDVADPRGGIRHVVPARARYWGADARARSLVTGGSADPLLPDLKFHLSMSKAADICVAFTLRSGIELLQAHLQELLDRKGRLRLLTGDYLDATDPDALARLTDLVAEPGDFECRVFTTRHGGLRGIDGRSFHPKSYLFHHQDGSSAAFVGSSNLSETALSSGIEWNYRLSGPGSHSGVSEVQSAFEALFHHPQSKPLTEDWIADYRMRRQRPQTRPVAEVEEDPEPTVFAPHSVQSEALAALQETRADGYQAGLVVLATGLGKTWLSAFDSIRFARVLFIAHREEILRQARQTFRFVRPKARLGLYSGTEKDLSAAVVFASVQTLAKQAHLDRFAPDAFDYIVMDEFHHAESRTYRKVLAHFRPKFLLGLTATPERNDGGDLLALCGDNLVYRCDLVEGIRRGLLCPFKYLGVADTIDFRNIPWRNSRFDQAALSKAAETTIRAQNALDQHRRHAGQKAFAFCVSTAHADFMAGFFKANGVKAVAVHSAPTSAPRTASLEALRDGTISVICTVDMFNEGVDVPELDTVMMLRPTESRIVFLQQLGRGLRLSQAGKRLTVIDYIGNHRSFLLKPQALLGLSSDHVTLRKTLLDQVELDSVLPPGCEVTYDLQAIDFFREMLSRGDGAVELLAERYDEFLEEHGVRPSASEMLREGYRIRVARPTHGSWLSFVRSKGGLTGGSEAVFVQYLSFLEHLEKAPMERSYKMLVLIAMLNLNRFPGPVSAAALSDEILLMSRRDRRVMREIESITGDHRKLVALLKKNPLAAWTGEAGGNFFVQDGSGFRFRQSVDEENTSILQEFVREIAEWRLEDYFQRPSQEQTSGYVLSVTHANKRPILMLPERARYKGLPSEWTDVHANDETVSMNFVKVAVNVAHREGQTDNVLAEILRGWFGERAGFAGTGFKVMLTLEQSGWVLQPKHPE